MNLNWKPILERAAELVNGFDVAVTLRQLHYLLVSERLIPNTLIAYKGLSKQTAQARRDGWFPALLDQTRSIERPQTYDSPEEARDDLKATYRRDRREGQPESLLLGCEKHTLLPQFWEWFSDLGIPILPLGGYSSQTYIDRVRDLCVEDGRTVRLIYIGDYDPSGEDIERDFVERVGVIGHVERVAILPEQVDEYGLLPNPGKITDSRAPGFIARHGELVQVEVEALPPDTLRDLVQEAIDPHWDTSAYQACLERERQERAAL